MIKKTFTSKDGKRRLGLPLTLPILAQMQKIEGWLSRTEAELMLWITHHALNVLPEPHVIVEVGSYCGRSTVVLGAILKLISPRGKLYAIDPHNGVVSTNREAYLGPGDPMIRQTIPTVEKFRHNIEANGLTSVVRAKKKLSFEVDLDEPIAILFIDGLHDYQNVCRDFLHFQKLIINDGYVLFHDYSQAYPGVTVFVNKVLECGFYRKVKLVDTLVALQKVSTAPHTEIEKALASFARPGKKNGVQKSEGARGW